MPGIQPNYVDILANMFNTCLPAITSHYRHGVSFCKHTQMTENSDVSCQTDEWIKADITCKACQVLNSFLSCLSGFYRCLGSFAAVLLGISHLPRSLSGSVGTFLLQKVGLPQGQRRCVV